MTPPAVADARDDEDQLAGRRSFCETHLGGHLHVIVAVLIQRIQKVCQES